MNLIKGLTGLRGYAAFLVFVCHMSMHSRYFGAGEMMATWLRELGGIGVSVFFVLSGFVLFINYPARKNAAGDFYVARFARIYPAYFFCILLSLPLEIFSPTKTHQALSFIMNILLCQQFFLVTQSSLNDVGWTLSVEAFFYLLFPLITVVIIRNSPGRAVLFTALMFALSAGLVAGLYPSYYSTSYFPPLRLFEFSAGMTAGLLYKQIDASKRNIARDAWLCCTGIAGLALSPLLVYALPVTALYSHLLYGSFAVCLVWSTASLELKGCSSPWLTSHVALIAGEISYSFYLLHHLVSRYFIHVIEIVFKQDFAQWMVACQLIASAALFAITAVAAWLLFVYLEVPLRKLIRHRLFARGVEASGA